MGHLSQTRVLVSLTKLQVNRVESHPFPHQRNTREPASLLPTFVVRVCSVRIS